MDYLKIYQLFKADFPEDAYSVDSSRGFNLTTLKAQYIVERLNEVMGVTGWSISGQFNKDDNGVCFIGKLSLINQETKELIHEIEAIGFSEYKKNTGDTYKSARTDALSKAASYLGIGNDMFKGKITLNTKKPVTKEEKNATEPVKPRAEDTRGDTETPGRTTDSPTSFKNRARRTESRSL